MSLQKKFEKAAEDVQTLPKKPDNDTLLELYSLYKQGTQGDCDGKRPGMFNMVARAKYDAWAKRKGMSEEDAQQAYVDLVESLMS
jgi:acyl-CoA-binding protein